MPEELLALSPLDGRYASETVSLRDYFSESATIRSRIQVEIAYLMALSESAGLIRPITAAETGMLDLLWRQFSLDDARSVKGFEQATRHDVKAIENFLRAKLAPSTLADLVEFLHFGLTSEDVNNIGSAIALRDSRDRVLLPALDGIIAQLATITSSARAIPMLARTHGQPAVPTTFGKEIAVFLSRLKRQRMALARHRFDAKLNGAVGDFNALTAAAPHVDWPVFSQDFIRGLNLEPAAVTTQTLPFDNWIEYFQVLGRVNSVLVGLAQDLWSYASLGYVRLKLQAAEVGSSTMPQKVNPIDFENAEGNLGVANSLFEFYARKLPATRLQRDLSDSTVRRTFGVALGHSLVAYKSMARGLALIEVDSQAMRRDLDAHWEVVAEGAQTILRLAGVNGAYDLLKQLTRGKGLTQAAYENWIDELQVAEAVKLSLRALTPANYTGLAAHIADDAVRGE